MKFKKIEEQNDGWSDWIRPTPRSSYKMACCDCGLVHDLVFESIQVERRRGGWVILVGILDPATHWLQFKARRNKRLTKQLRATASSAGTKPGPN